MKAIKDFLYRNNDIIIVFLIIAIGVGIIYVKTNSILHYKSDTPVVVAEKNKETKDNDNSNYEKDNEDKNKDNKTTELIVDADSSIEQVSKTLYELRITESEDDFTKKMEEYDGTRVLQPGTYNIDIDESLDNILKKITKVE